MVCKSLNLFRTAQAWSGGVGRSGRTRGQTILEVTLVLLLLIIITMSIIQYALITNASSTLNDITRAGARYAAMHATESVTRYNGTDMTPDAAIRAYIQDRCRGSFISRNDLPDNRITITPASGNAARTTGNPITVETSYDMRRKLFLPRSFPGLARFGSNYRTSVTHVIE